MIAQHYLHQTVSKKQYWYYKTVHQHYSRLDYLSRGWLLCKLSIFPSASYHVALLISRQSVILSLGLLDMSTCHLGIAVRLLDVPSWLLPVVRQTHNGHCAHNVQPKVQGPVQMTEKKNLK